MEDFLLRAALGGIGLAVVAGPIGCFVVWRRMAYFGDSLAHSALLGIALGFILGVDPTFGVVATAVTAALLMAGLQLRQRLASDTMLGIISHGGLAFGLIAIGLTQGLRTDLFAYLFGDVLAIDKRDLAWIWIGGALALIGLAVIWRPLLALTVHEELARAEGKPVAWAKLAYLLLIALLVAVAMKIVGVLLVTALLIIPAAAARGLSRSPEAMAALAALAGILSVLAGLAASWWLDTPSGPSIVAAATVLFFLVAAGGGAFRRP
ncbi:MAG TPA: metal ABC transporter permease [Alphaproteobacteria bacterium]|nr:metal ABC transporter permease [Alphaproteobacteria bacterium]